MKCIEDASKVFIVCMRMYVHACEHVCVSVCVHACMCVCVCSHAHMRLS